MSSTAIGDADVMVCYRHPDRETRVRCGRCEEPICTRCAMQGPVGWRCVRCGRAPRDPLTVLTPRQLALGLVVALGAGTLAGLVGLRVGFLLSLCIGPVIGALIGRGVMRATGYRRGRSPLALALLGIGGGVAIAAAVSYLTFATALPREALAEGVVASLIIGDLTGAVVYVAAASIGAYARLR